MQTHFGHDAFRDGQDDVIRATNPALPAFRKAAAFPRMNAAHETIANARARQAYREHHGYVYWSTHPLMEINEKDIPFVIAGLRSNGGHKEWLVAQSLVAPR